MLERCDVVSGRVTGRGDGAQEGASVVGHAAVLDQVALAVGVQHDVAGPEVIHDRVADAAEVHGAHPAHDAIGRLVSVSGEYHIGVRARECRSKVGLLRSEEHTSELQSLMRISYAVFCLKKKKQITQQLNNNYDYK